MFMFFVAVFFLRIYNSKMENRFNSVYRLNFWCNILQNAIVGTPKKKYENSVGFYNHFRKDFIQPYGLAHDQNSCGKSTFCDRLTTINYGFYVRPQIAIWEFAETVLVNLHYVKENVEILEQQSIAGFIKKTRKIEKYLAVLETGMYLIRVPSAFLDVSILDVSVYLSLYIYINLLADIIILLPQNAW